MKNPKIRYMFENTVVSTDPLRYKVCGVWAQGSGTGLDIAMEFLPLFEEEQERADWIVNRLVENDVKSVGEDFLEYHQQSRSPYAGTFSEIFETEEYENVNECCKGELGKVRKTVQK